LNYSLAWSYEPGNLNPDLTKPALLIPLVGAGGLNPPADRANRVSLSLGFAWSATRDGKTVVRGGAGKYGDPASSNSQNVNNERRFLLPFGSVRSPIPGSSIRWNGVPLDFIQPTSFTAADLVSILPGIRADLLGQRDPNNHDFSVREIDVQKTGQNLMDPFFVAPYSLHASLGVQREIARNLVVTADFVYRRFVHTFLIGVDYNRYNRFVNGVRTPVIPLCTGAQANNPSAVCSSGVITFDNTSGLARYQGLLVRVDKRFSKRIQFLGSYARASNTGANGPGASAAGPGVTGGGFNISPATWSCPPDSRRPLAFPITADPRFGHMWAGSTSTVMAL
jgi:hypothetical protein